MKMYNVTIGMEVHVELATKSKMFCSCKNGMGLETEPNKNICPVCTGQPGSLPVPNQQAIEFVINAGLALNCHIADVSKFDRKNYFYPDLPKGYQISQYDQPICQSGFLEFSSRVLGTPGQALAERGNGQKENDSKGELEKRMVRIHRIHLEEDTGKLIHTKGTGETLVDFNRAGVPLMELVTEADIKSAQEAKKFCEELQLLFRYIGISPADMEKGQMRCEANISLYQPGQDPLSGTKVELKNLNSFKAVERGIEYETRRQSELLQKGAKIVQETRGWDESRGLTFSQREKEQAHDYRYFPEPDIPPFILEDSYVEQLRKKLPELPSEKRKRFEKQCGLRSENAEVLVMNKEIAGYFEQVASELEAWIEAEGHEFKEEDKSKLYRLAANYIITELSRKLSMSGTEVGALKISAENFAELIKIVYEGKINSSAAQIVLNEMFVSGADPSNVIEQKNLGQTSDEGELGTIIDGVLENNQKSVEDFRNGKENAIKFLMGQVMSATKGKANPQIVIKLLEEKLK